MKGALPSPESLGLSSATTKVQFWTAMDSMPIPLEQRPVTLNSGLEDHLFIFSDCWFPVGAAFSFGAWPGPSQGQPAPVRLVSASEPGTFPVAKSLASISGQTVLIEEMRYIDVASALSALPHAAAGSAGAGAVQMANRGRLLPEAPSLRDPDAKAFSVASTAYAPEGFLMDYTILTGGTSGYTFNSGATYYIPNGFDTGAGAVTFQNGACLKFGTNGVNTWFVTYGPVSFPYSGQPVIFTSKDDNTYGQIITNSTANPTYSAAQELWFYYETIPTTVQNCVFRWAQRCVQYDENGGVFNSPALQVSVFQDSQIGVYARMASDTLYLSSDSYCNVATPVQRTSGTVNGLMTYDCGVVSVAMVNDPSRDLSGLDTNKNSQTECSFAVLNSTNIVAAFMNTHLSEYTLGGPVNPFPGIPSPRMASWAVSTDGGAHFTDKGPVPPISTTTNGSTVITNGASNALYGDAGDTTIAYDPQKNVVYLLANPSRENTNFYGFRLWASRDNGQNFTPVNMDVPGRNTNGSHFISEADKPALKLSGTNIYVAGSQAGPNIWASHSVNGGTNWDAPHVLDTASSGDVRGVDILILPDGTVYFFWLSTSGTINQLRYSYLATNGVWSSAANVGPSFKLHRH
ncbi:MAG TPA: hypothetical protein VKY92_18150 [Verrucomicrobiae bacterium]|nr:hypothetical protein [Verrucomicrobiae bacterium]